jgi:hypothetical protein
MDLIATWGWPAWTLAVLFVGFVCWLLWRWLAALVFRHLLLDGLLRRYGWQAEQPGGGGARAEFEQQVRQRRREGWDYLRQGGWRHLREGYRTGPFGEPTASPWRADVVISGAFRGRTFLASQVRSDQLSSGDHAQVATRRRASLELHVVPPPFDAGSAVPRFEARTGRLTGSVRGAPPGLETLVCSRRFQVVRCDGATLFLSLGPRLRRGPLLAGLEHLSRIADRLQERR